MTEIEYALRHTVILIRTKKVSMKRKYINIFIAIHVTHVFAYERSKTSNAKQSNQNKQHTQISRLNSFSMRFTIMIAIHFACMCVPLYR